MAARRAAPPAATGADFARNADAILGRAAQSLFEQLDQLCEGCIAIDAEARVIWINDKYLAMLGLARVEDALGREIEEIIPKSMMREVVRTAKPILLDIMEFGRQSFVVTRMPLFDGDGRVIGAVGFVLYDRLEFLKPLVAKFTRMQAELDEVSRKLAENRRPRYTLASFVGGSPACLEVKRKARRAAQQDTTVLLLGETGTGKELLAHAIHEISRRARAPFIALNVAAIPETLLEAELFGAVAGAYTGADRRGRDGKFRIADGGTLFLDEIGDMPLALQAKLLRVLQDQSFEPLGSDRVVRVDVRIVAATRADLAALVAQGRFRADLYYRLNVLPIAVPPLRERLADLDVLCETIFDEIALRTGTAHREVSPEGVALLARHDWPGNVRELRNVLEQAAMLSDSQRLGARDFASIMPVAASDGAVPATQEVRRYDEAFREFERETLKRALAASGGRVAEAARLLDLSRATLYKKLAADPLFSRRRDNHLDS